MPIYSFTYDLFPRSPTLHRSLIPSFIHQDKSYSTFPGAIPHIIVCYKSCINATAGRVSKYWKQALSNSQFKGLFARFAAPGRPQCWPHTIVFTTAACNRSVLLTVSLFHGHSWEERVGKCSSLTSWQPSNPHICQTDCHMGNIINIDPEDLWSKEPLEKA